ncbi:MAG: cytochrome b [Gammaproteobacteria bacterium]|nr:cytochrome b [Gammaproteobacteria bacterium]
MTLRNTGHRWGWVSQLLHWLILAMLAWLGWRGLTMVDMDPSPAMIEAYALHKSVGLTLLALVALRLAWRLFAGSPRPVPGTPTWQKRMADLTHAALYVLMFAIPLSGWLFNSASGYPLQWFKLFNLPAIAGSSEALADLASQVHVVGFWLLVLLVAAHAGAALYHHFVQRDDTLRRMLPQRRRAPGPIQQTPGGMA